MLHVCNMSSTHVACMQHVPHDVRKLVAQGWEVVSTSGKENWFWGSDFQAVLRRPNPKCRG